MPFSFVGSALSELCAGRVLCQPFSTRPRGRRGYAVAVKGIGDYLKCWSLVALIGVQFYVPMAALHAQALIKPFDISNADESVDSAGLRVIQTHETKLNRFGKAAITGLSDSTQETERVSRVQADEFSFSGNLFDNTVHRPTRAALPINSTEAHFARPGFGTNFTTFSASHEGNDPTPARSRAADGTGSDAKQGILAPGLMPASIGTATPADEIHTLADGGYAVTSAGIGATLASDQIVFGWEQRTGDFDQKVRVESLAPGGIWSQAGLMVRETLDPGSRFAASFATPSLNGSYFASRARVGTKVSATGTFPANYPQTWLRLQRRGNLISGYASFDGIEWTSMGAVTLPFPATVYVGLAAASQDNSTASTASFHELRDASGDAVVQVQTTLFEPLGASSRKTGLVISEIMYQAPAQADGKHLEYVELFNTNPWQEDIGGYQLAGDITYTFPVGITIAGGGFVVVGKAPADLQSVYGLKDVLGPFENAPLVTGILQLLNNGTTPAVYLEVPYLSLGPWTVAAHGTGYSLVLKRPSYGEGFVEAWGVSELLGGSPGAMETYIPSPLRSVAMNEFLAHPGDAESGYVELYNHSNQSVDVSGCRLKSFPGVNLFVVPSGTIISAKGFTVFTQSQLGFTLNPTGGAIQFETPDARHLLDVISFDAQEQGVPWGRAPDGGNEFRRLVKSTPGAANSAPIISEVAINELMYKSIHRLKDDQFIELYNRGESTVNLSGWQFTGGIKFTFPFGTMIQPDGYLVVGKNKALLLTNYPNLHSANTLGDFGGSLSGNGERVALARPMPFVTVGKNAVLTTNFVQVVIDEVVYRAGGRWGEWSDGGGSSLEVRDPRADHRLADNWGDSDETSKAEWTTIEATSRLDLGATQGGTPIDRIEVLMSGASECLLDNVEVIESLSGTNRLTVANSNFESGLGSWVATGDHIQTTWETGSGFGGGNCLHLRSSDRGDTLVNHLRVPLTKPLTSGQTVTLRAKVRWLRGFPELVLRVKGNYAEATGAFKLPSNLGTPGTRNSEFIVNAGPAFADVTHSPPLPRDRQSVVVTARVDDPDGLSKVLLRYRLDPIKSYTEVRMRDDGAGGDAVAGDGVYSGTIPGMPTGTLVAFYLAAVDNALSPAISQFPRGLPQEECLVRFGEPALSSAFESYHFWLTQDNANRWTAQGSISNERHDGTFVYGNSRIIYNVKGKFAGSPYHQGFGSPLANNCHYSLQMPGDDRLLGATSFNKIHAPGNGPWEDDTLQREQTAYWMVRQLGLPWNYRRYVNFFINGNRRQPSALMEDTQTPDADVIAEHFPNDTNGNLYKLQPWFEFADNGQNFDNQAWCTLNNYISGGQKKLARYRPNFLVRAAKQTANDYTNVYQLIDTANLPNSGTAQRSRYVAAMDALVDTDEWLRTMAVEHAVGNWDSFLNSNGQNMYAYKPTAGRWTLFIWDYNIVLGLGNYSDGPTGDDLFKTTTGDNGSMSRFAGTPIYRRAQWRAYEELANSAMNNPSVDGLLDARYAAFRAEGISASSPTALKTWIKSRHSFLVAQLKKVATTFSISNSGGTDFDTTDNPLVLSGTAPVVVQDIQVNGVVFPAVWTDLLHWQVTVPLAGITNPLVVSGLDRLGKVVVGESSHFVVTYRGALESAVGRIVVNEIMYHPAVTNAEFIELYNAATNTPYDLSHWRLDGVGYTFPDGQTLMPGSYLVLAKSRSVFVATYGGSIPIAGEFNGFPKDIETTLKLVKPGNKGDEDLEVTAVRFRKTAPWPVAADGAGASLQLIDPTRDNWRVGNWATSAGDVSARSTPGRINAVLSRLPEFPSVWINEVLPANTTTNVDNFGQSDPFIELYNNGTDLVDLTGFSLSDGYTNQSSWNFPAGASVAPGKFLVVWADAQPEQSAPNALHTSFRLNAESGSIVLARSFGAPVQTGVLDYLDYSLLGPGRSLGSFPDGQPFQRHRFDQPTPGASNSLAPGSHAVVINEWMASNSHTITNAATGLPDDWFELYNRGPQTVDLAGFQLSSPISSPNKFVIPVGTILPPYGFLLVWADKHTSVNTAGMPLHVDFHLVRKGADIGLFSPDGSLVDGVSFNTQTVDVSEGRAPDGTDAPFSLFPLATPGVANVPLRLRAHYDPGTGRVHLEWPTEPGRHYRLVTRDSISAVWQPLAEFTAVESVTRAVDERFGGDQRYYGLIFEGQKQ